MTAVLGRGRRQRLHRRRHPHRVSIVQTRTQLALLIAPIPLTRLARSNRSKEMGAVIRSSARHLDQHLLRARQVIFQEGGEVGLIVNMDPASLLRQAAVVAAAARFSMGAVQTLVNVILMIRIASRP